MSRRAVDWIAAVRILLFAGLLILGIFLPLPALEGVPLCFYYARFGRLCPGCGMTRAFFHIMLGAVPGAFALHPVFTTLYFPIMLILFCNDLYCFSRRVFGKRESESFLDGIFTGRLYENIVRGRAR